MILSVRVSILCDNVLIMQIIIIKVYFLINFIISHFKTVNSKNNSDVKRVENE